LPVVVALLRPIEHEGNRTLWQKKIYAPKAIKERVNRKMIKFFVLGY
jgi:hypothetical protein